MHPSVPRRHFLRDSLRLGGALLAAPSLAGLAACNDIDPLTPEGAPNESRARRALGYGPLQADPGGLPFLIPPGFTLRLLSRAGDPLAGGGVGRVPNALDGMAAFAMPNGQVRLVRNHEIRNAANTTPPIGQRPYDPAAGAGCTTLVLDIDPATGAPTLRREFVSISGTFVNCAGGPTPWGSWLTCEETVAGPNSGFRRRHGYVFEVPAGADDEVEPVPYPAMGRFSHEAVAIDPRDGIVYLTEDGASGLSGFYRFLPRVPGQLGAGGTLQMLEVTGRPQFNATGRVFGTGPGAVPAVPVPPFVPLEASWVTIDRPDPDLEGTPTDTVFAQGLAKGGARFRRLEGCWWGDESVYFNDTNGGAVGAGRVWQYRPQPGGNGVLTLIFESPSADVLDAPDNICVSPRGGLVICEDGGGTQFLRGLTRAGQVFDFVRAADPNEATEFCGSCYSPDGRVLFFNTQGSTDAQGSDRGGTFALWGPWGNGPL